MMFDAVVLYLFYYFTFIFKSFYYYYYYPPFSATPGYWRLARQNPPGEKTVTDLSGRVFLVTGVCSRPQAATSNK